MKKRIIRIAFFYIIGLILFNFILLISQLLVLTVIERIQDFAFIIKDKYLILQIIYTIIYVIWYLPIYIHDRMLIKLLNRELKLAKERKQNNEKEIYNCSCSNY